MSKVLDNSPSEVGPYKLFNYLGEGAFSIVRECKKEGSDELLACKVVPKTKMNTDKLMDRFEIEIRINQQLHHPGIVQMMDLLCDKQNYYIIMEICKNGDLLQFIGDKGKLKEADAKPVFHQILETMAYLHHMGVAHRDMKPENVLIDSEGHVKIADFGLAKFVDQNNMVLTPCGSPCYASPECLKSGGGGKQYNGFTNDAWGCGVILYQMLTGTIPWTKKAQAQMFAQIMKGEYSVPSSLSKEAKKLIKGLICVDTTKRMTIENVLNDKWFKGMSSLYDLTRPRGYVSLRQVDIYFGKEIKDLKLTDEIETTSSMAEFKLRYVLKKLLGVESSIVKRRKKRKHSDEGHSSRHRHHHRKSEVSKEPAKKEYKLEIPDNNKDSINNNDSISNNDGISNNDNIGNNDNIIINNSNNSCNINDSSNINDSNNNDDDSNNNNNSLIITPEENGNKISIDEISPLTIPSSNVVPPLTPEAGELPADLPAEKPKSPRHRRKKSSSGAKKSRRKKTFLTYIMPKSATHVSEDVKPYQTIVQDSDKEDSGGEETNEPKEEIQQPQ